MHPQYETMHVLVPLGLQVSKKKLQQNLCYLMHPNQTNISKTCIQLEILHIQNNSRILVCVRTYGMCRHGISWEG